MNRQRSWMTLLLALVILVGGSACGRYGPPSRYALPPSAEAPSPAAPGETEEEKK